MKVHSYARDIKLNTKCGNTKIYSFITIIIIFFFVNFIIPNVYRHLGYLAGIMV